MYLGVVNLLGLGVRYAMAERLLDVQILESMCRFNHWFTLMVHLVVTPQAVMFPLHPIESSHSKKDSIRIRLLHHTWAARGTEVFLREISKYQVANDICFRC